MHARRRGAEQGATAKVGIKVKLGPMSMQYKGQVEIVEKDPEAQSAVMSATAKETRGRMHKHRAHVPLRQRRFDQGPDGGRRAAQRQGRGHGPVDRGCSPPHDTFAQNLAEMLSAERPAEGCGGGARPGGAAPRAERSLPSGRSPRAWSREGCGPA